MTLRITAADELTYVIPNIYDAFETANQLAGNWLVVGSRKPFRLLEQNEPVVIKIRNNTDE